MTAMTTSKRAYNVRFHATTVDRASAWKLACVSACLGMACVNAFGPYIAEYLNAHWPILVAFNEAYFFTAEGEFVLEESLRELGAFPGELPAGDPKDAWRRFIEELVAEGHGESPGSGSAAFRVPG